jgi:hypothetical protein
VACLLDPVCRARQGLAPSHDPGALLMGGFVQNQGHIQHPVCGHAAPMRAQSYTHTVLTHSQSSTTRVWA